MDFEKHLELFREIGLTEREAKVYVTLLTKRFFTASELQEVVEIPRTKIYEVLGKMISKGICSEHKVGINKVYEAVNPKIAFAEMNAEYLREVQHKSKTLNDLTQIFTPVFEAGKLLEPPQDYIEVYKDKLQIHRKYVSLVNTTCQELLTLNKGPYSCDVPEKVEEQFAMETGILQRGGKTRSIYVRSELSELGWLQSYMQEQAELGHEARVADDVPIKMLVFDNSAVMFALDIPGGEPNNLTMIAVEHSSIASACRILFDSLWEKSGPYTASVNRNNTNGKQVQS